MPTQYKTGRLPATQPAALKDLDVYSVGPLQTPPTTWAVPLQAQLTAGDPIYPIDCNQRLGCCTYSGVDHLNRAWDSLFDETVALPTETEIEKAYFVETGGQDTGCVEANVLKRWNTTGIFGTKIAAYAPVSTTSLLQQHQSIAFYGGCYLGIVVGQPQQEAFQKGEEWVWVDGQEEDGHCVVAVGYGPNGGLHCLTWGGVAVLSPGFLAHSLSEAWCVLSQQLVAAKKDTLGLDLEALQADLSKV